MIGAFLDDEKGVYLVNVTKAISRNQGHRDGLVDALIESLKGHSASTFEPPHDE